MNDDTQNSGSSENTSQPNNSARNVHAIDHQRTGRTAAKDSGIDQSGVKASNRGRGIYVLPNLFTTAGLFAGFYAIMQARAGNFEAACLAIFAAMIMDIIDGRLARLTNTQTEFGSQYDSLADMVSFGVAPAFILFDYVLQDLGRIGSLIAFVYIACAALRLARFNSATISDKRFFMGLPSPGAAAMLATVVWVMVDYGISPAYFSPALGLLMILLALAMVSNIKYRSFKDVEVREQVPFIGLILLVIVISIIYLDPPLAFLLIGGSYITGGAAVYFYKKINKFRRREAAEN